MAMQPTAGQGSAGRARAGRRRSGAPPRRWQRVGGSRRGSGRRSHNSTSTTRRRRIARMPDDLSSAWPPAGPAPRATAPPVQPVPTRWRYQPVASALWRAMMMDGPTLATTLASESATRLDVLAARAVDLACGGNIKAMGLIAERIEGRVGVRPGEIAPEDEARRENVQAAMRGSGSATMSASPARRRRTERCHLVGYCQRGTAVRMVASKDRSARRLMRIFSRCGFRQTRHHWGL